MKLIKSVFQGNKNNPVFVSEQLQHVYSLDDIQTTTLGMAFVRSGGVKLLIDNIANLDEIEKYAYIGINNQSTSIQGVQALIEAGFAVYGIDTGRQDCIFHPKIIACQNHDSIRFIHGSANLTKQGMTKNFESSLILECKNQADSAYSDIKSLLDQLVSLPDIYPNNAIRLHHEMLEDLLVKGQLENEATAFNTETRGYGDLNNNEDNSRTPIDIPTVKAKVKPKAPLTPKAEVDVIEPSYRGGVAVYVKNKLSNSDAQIAGTKKTNVKGYMTLGNKNMRHTDSKTYMRQNIFGDLNWNYNKVDDRDEAFAWFQLFIDGTLVGREKLLITDKQSREPAHHGLADQKQPTTALHVCSFGRIFNNVHGKDLTIYKIDTNNYQLDIN